MTAFKWVGLLAFLLWETWWGYVFLTAPRPDEKMNTVVAIFCGVVLPIALAILVGAFYALRAVHRTRH
jgi:hypothetical protein